MSSERRSKRQRITSKTVGKRKLSLSRDERSSLGQDERSAPDSNKVPTRSRSRRGVSQRDTALEVPVASKASCWRSVSWSSKSLSFFDRMLACLMLVVYAHT